MKNDIKGLGVDYVNIAQASKLTGKSISTIRRFVINHKGDSSGIIKTEINKKNRITYKINKCFLKAYFNLSNEFNDKIDFLKNKKYNIDRRLLKKVTLYQIFNRTIKRLLFLTFVLFSAVVAFFIYELESLKDIHQQHLTKLKSKYLEDKNKSLEKEKSIARSYEESVKFYQNLLKEKDEKINLLIEKS